MKITLSVAEIGKIVSALQNSYPADIESFYLEKDLIYYAKDYFDNLPDNSSLFENWVQEFNIDTYRQPPRVKE